MKKVLLTLVIAIGLFGCSNDKLSDEQKGFTLPDETQTGANTFGVTINNKVYIPRDPTGVNVGPQGHGMIFTFNSPDPWRELIIVDGASAVGFKMVLHFKDLVNQGVGIYTLKQSNFQDNIDSIDENHIYFKIWDNALGNYAYYGSIENQGEIKITKRDSGIISGIFKGKFARYGSTTDIIEITNGRFDIKTATLISHVFP
ncbi:hypothetical protein [Flavobacterium sp.]|uniref:hypothetical protein n=1 Tax=Flavobacterium sp. TaxID=239 RepID=UPI003752CCF3